ncbi:MAG: capsule biosynthesis protein [Alphaproteobacteria bacterium]|nr:MAG: capsule biosynthesis protein [Alphaproteobacteria bacterium]
MDALDHKLPTLSRRGNPYAPVRQRSWAGRIWFVLVVIVPTAITASYMFGYAADQYVSEARFVVRGPASQSAGVLNGLLQSTGLSHAQEDTYVVQDYMQSRDAMAELIAHDDLRDVFARSEADPLFRFPLWSGWSSDEHLFQYFKSHASAELDSTTGVSTLTVRTFRAIDSQHIALALLEAGEGLVNRMNERQRDNTLRQARKDVADAEKRVTDVSREIAQFRNRESILDPTKQSVPLLSGINDLQMALVRTNIQVAQLTVNTPKSPLIPELQRRAKVLQDQIDQARTQITGPDTSLVPKIAAFDALALQQGFADKLLGSAVQSYEVARIAAERQELYLETIVQPNLSDYPGYPKRLATVAVVFATFLGLYVGGGLVLSAAREHRLH